jgi:hypothetical protein
MLYYAKSKLYRESTSRSHKIRDYTGYVPQVETIEMPGVLPGNVLSSAVQ